jgi:hypothetical protein
MHTYCGTILFVSRGRYGTDEDVTVACIVEPGINLSVHKLAGPEKSSWRRQRQYSVLNVIYQF